MNLLALPGGDFGPYFSNSRRLVAALAEANIARLHLRPLFPSARTQGGFELAAGLIFAFNIMVGLIS